MAKSLGRHVLLELWGCRRELLNDVARVQEILLEAAQRARCTIIDKVSHGFSPYGVSVVVLIAESHLSIHTWPEHDYAAVDIFTCGESLQPEEVNSYFISEFGAVRHTTMDIPRGILSLAVQ